MNCEGDEDREITTEQEHASGEIDAVLSGGLIDEVGISTTRIWSCLVSLSMEALVDRNAVGVMDMANPGTVMSLRMMEWKVGSHIFREEIRLRRVGLPKETLISVSESEGETDCGLLLFSPRGMWRDAREGVGH